MEGNFHHRKAGIGVFHARFLFHSVHNLPECPQNLFFRTFKKSDRTQMRWMGVKGAFDVVNGRAINAVFARIQRQDRHGIFDDPLTCYLCVECIGLADLPLSNDFNALRICYL